ncbi:MAG: hypothetical protein HXY48_12170, partial [Ignavibacteriaceae bacterium]|nr:hypothetical protein [Ignavibacteriaceae bacterium]
MKQKTHHPVSARQRRDGLYYLYYPRGWIIVALLLFSAIVMAQEQTPPGGEFIVGAPFSGILERRIESIYYDTFYNSGMNTIFQYAVNGASGNQGLLERYNVLAVNHDALDWIGYYSTCYYTRWQAEQDQTDPERVGVKHVGGQIWLWHDTLSWSTRNLIAPACSLIYGPHYRQDNRYKSWAHGDRHDVDYYVRFNMALDNSSSADSSLPVCKIKVVYRYAEEYPSGSWEIFEDTFLERTLTVGDFPQGGYFKYFYFEPVQYYEYPEKFILPEYAGKLIDPEPPDTITYNDSEAGLGIQFRVDWLIDSNEESGLTLYVDHIEVFDRDWWDYVLYPNLVADSIQIYASRYSNWSNIKYFTGHDEPYSIDAFAPIRIVDSLLEISQNPRLLIVFNPYWTYNNKINGDTLLCQFVRMAKPEKLVIDFYPFTPEYLFRFVDAEALRFRFQLCHTLQPGFWYMAQAFGEFYEYEQNNWIPLVWRYPEDEELKASVMLALAHGSKGLFFLIYDSWKYRGADYGLEYDTYYQKGLVDTLDENNQLNPTPLWYYLKDNLIPRLKGKLGNTLMNLNYTGEYLQLQRKENESPPPPVEHNYLIL